MWSVTWRTSLKDKVLITDEGPIYRPADSAIELPVRQTSSTARALCDLLFFITWEADVPSTIIIDEPELNLHPRNQVRLARYLVKLVNLGMRVVITTHSDYIVRELGIATVNHDHGVGGPDGTEPVAAVNMLGEQLQMDIPRINPQDVGVYYTARDNGDAGGITVKQAEDTRQEGRETLFFDDVIADRNIRLDHAFGKGAAVSGISAGLGSFPQARLCEDCVMHNTTGRLPPVERQDGGAVIPAALMPTVPVRRADFPYQHLAQWHLLCRLSHTTVLWGGASRCCCPGVSFQRKTALSSRSL
nr:AAA family ATPase [Corynebacterium mendelii]